MLREYGPPGGPAPKSNRITRQEADRVQSGSLSHGGGNSAFSDSRRLLSRSAQKRFLSLALAVSPKPSFTVVFIEPPVKFVSKNAEGFSSEEQKTLAQIASLVSAMSKDGIKLEICMIAAGAFGVDSKSILPEITQINNGYVSLIGHQATGYSLVPIC